MPRIVLIDLDDTLIDDALGPTSEGGWGPVCNAVYRLQLQGTLVGLNSDTPIRTLQQYAELLGLRGPIVGELGQIISWNKSETPTVLANNAGFFSQFRNRIIAQLIHEPDHPFVCVGDVNQYPRKLHGTIHQRAFLINGLRQCSFSMFVFGRVEDNLVIQGSRSEEALTLMKGALGERSPNEFWFDQRCASGIVIMHEKNASKGTAYSEIIKNFGHGWSYEMIGDGSNDIIEGTQVPVTIHAVGNATPSVKLAALASGGISASRAATQGVIDILNCLADERASAAPD